jgi:hypothetical protein
MVSEAASAATAAGGAPVWLFVSYGGGHVNALLPVARRVRELGIARPVYLALTTAAAAVRSSGLPTLGFRDFLAPEDVRAQARGEALAAQLEVQAADHAESVAYLGLSYVEMEDRLGEAAAAQRWARYGRQALLPLGVLERILRACGPALVVATNSPRAEQAAIESAGALGLPSACLVDLLGIWERELLARPDYASAVCVLNEAVRASLLAAGRPPADVHVTGNPAFDGINDAAAVALGKRYREQLGWDGLHVCLYASSPEPLHSPGVAGTGDPAFPRLVEERLVRAVQADPGLALWIRRHPSERPANELEQAGHPRIRISGSELPLHACLHGSDEVIVTVSTVGVEASLAGKPVTQVRGSILDHLSPYLAMGVAGRELTLDQLGDAYAPEAERMRRTAATGASSGAGHATESVVQVLLALQERFRVP